MALGSPVPDAQGLKFPSESSGLAKTIVLPFGSRNQHSQRFGPPFPSL